jgi:hypothetical protein
LRDVHHLVALALGAGNHGHRQDFRQEDGDSRAIHGPIGLIRGGLAAGEVSREAGDPVLDLRPDEVAGHRRASTW